MSAARVALLALVVSGCAGGAAEIRKHTYPPDFTYVERRNVRSVMWELADGVAMLDRGLRPSGGGEPDVALVVEALRVLDGASGRLPAEETSNHPMLGERAERFRRDIDLALAQASHEPPSLTLAGSVAGACLYCHAPAAR